jgi:hypothetical protein
VKSGEGLEGEIMVSTDVAPEVSVPTTSTSAYSTELAQWSVQPGVGGLVNPKPDWECGCLGFGKPKRLVKWALSNACRRYMCLTTLLLVTGIMSRGAVGAVFACLGKNCLCICGGCARKRPPGPLSATAVEITCPDRN